MTQKSTPTMRFNCYLLSEPLTTPTDAFRSKYRPGAEQALVELAATELAPSGARAFLGKPDSKQPAWASKLQGMYPELRDVSGLANRFVILTPVQSRWLAICFGYASGVLDWDSVDTNFGLRVAARLFRDGTVTDVKSRRIDSSGRTQQVQMSSGAFLREMGIQLEGEFVRKVSGRAASSTEAESLGGIIIAGDSISFKSEVDLRTVVQTLEEWLELIEAEDPQDEFAFIDALTPLRSKSTSVIEMERALSKALVDKLSDNSVNLETHVLQFIPPEDVDLDNVDYIKFSTGSREAVAEEFRMEDLRAALKQLRVRGGSSTLKSVRAVAIDQDGNACGTMRPLKDWLVYEASNGLDRYILTLGRWFKLDEDYSARLDRDLSKISDETAQLCLPDMRAHEKEGDYNLRAAAADSSLFLLDRNLVKTSDGGSIEACDLFSDKGHLIHVKRYSSSQTLSHLFSQGTVSVNVLGLDPDGKQAFISKFPASSSFLNKANLAPEIVTYAIAIDGRREFPQGLPTFAKVNLRDAAATLRASRVTPTIARIVQL